MLKVYTSGISPFSARVAMVLRAKELAFEDLGSPEDHWPEGGRKSPGFLAINPMGKVPVMILEDGTPLAESETIITYLDEAWPEPPLQPADPIARARMRSAIRLCESYVAGPIQQTFPMLDPAARSEPALDHEFAMLARGLRALATQAPDDLYFVGDRLSLADIVVFTTLYVAAVIPQVFGRADLLAAEPRLTGWYARARRDPLLGWGLEQLQAASRN